MPYEMLSSLQPTVRHLMREVAAGVPMEHVIWQAGLVGYLMGTGLPRQVAHYAVEQLENVGLVPSARAEMMALRGVSPFAVPAEYQLHPLALMQIMRPVGMPGPMIAPFGLMEDDPL